MGPTSPQGPNIPSPMRSFLGGFTVLVNGFSVINEVLTTAYFPERKAIAASLQLHEANDSFGKGFHVLNSSRAKSSRAKPFNDWAVPA